LIERIIKNVRRWQVQSSVIKIELRNLQIQAKHSDILHPERSDNPQQKRSANL
jgi:hypothetical protein